MKRLWTFQGLIFLLIAAFFSSCASKPPSRAEAVMWRWRDPGGTPDQIKIVINVSRQIAFIYRDDKQIGWCYTTTGKEGHATPLGTFPVTEKIADKHSNAYGYIENIATGDVMNGDATPKSPVPPGGRYVPAPMPFWHRLTSGGVGLHAGLIPKPGEVGSHGCIRLPKDFAPVLFGVTKVGTPVTIVQ